VSRKVRYPEKFFVPDKLNVMEKPDIVDAQWPGKYPEVDPYGPHKFDAHEYIARSYLDLMPKVTQTLDAITEHLEHGIREGKPFVRPQERPDVEGGAYEQLTSTIRLLDERLSTLERQARR